MNEIVTSIDELVSQRGIAREIVIEILEEEILAAYVISQFSQSANNSTIDRQTAYQHEVEGIEIPEDHGYTCHWDGSSFRVLKLGADVTPDDFGRVAAHTVRGQMKSRFNAVERQQAIDFYEQRIGTLENVLIENVDYRRVAVKLNDGTEGIMPKRERVNGEHYRKGDRLAVVVADTVPEGYGPPVIVSRRDPDLVRALFADQSVEVQDGLVEILSVARQPGQRSKLLVSAHDPQIDPAGALIGNQGTRIRKVNSILKGERIDIVRYDEDPVKLIKAALRPVETNKVLIDGQQAVAIVSEMQLEKAQADPVNLKLASKLSKYKISLSTQDVQDEQGEGEDGRCHFILRNGKRCPNAAVDDQYCGLEAHHA